MSKSEWLTFVLRGGVTFGFLVEFMMQFTLPVVYLSNLILALRKNPAGEKRKGVARCFVTF